MIQTSLEKDTGIVWSVVKGEVTIDTLVQKMLAIRIAAGESASELRVMNIFENITTTLGAQEIIDFFEIVKSNSKGIQSIKAAFVASTPRETALSMLYADTANKSHLFNVKVFSTNEAALHWLQAR